MNAIVGTVVCISIAGMLCYALFSAVSIARFNRRDAAARLRGLIEAYKWQDEVRQLCDWEKNPPAPYKGESSDGENP